MSYFTESAYLKAEKSYYGESALGMARKVADRPFQWSFGQVGYSDYARKYNAIGGCWGRKISALQGILGSLAKVVYYLAINTFIGIHSALHVDSQAMRMNLYCASREGMKVVGNFIKLFHDRFGSYVVEMNQFQKECYTMDFTEVPISFHSERYLQGISLSQYLAYPQFYTRSLPNLETLQRIAEGIQKYDPHFYDRCRLSDLFTRYKGENCFLSDSQLAEESRLADFAGVKDGKERLLRVRLLQQYSQEQDPTQLPYDSLFLLRATRTVFPEITDDDFQMLDFTTMTDGQADASLGIGEERTRRLSLLSKESIQILAEKGIDLSALSDTQLNDIDLSQLSGDYVFSLFPEPFGESSKERFASLSPHNQMTALRRCIYLWPLVTDEQIKAFPVSTLDYYQFKELFCSRFDDESKARVALCDQDELQKALNAGNVPPEVCALFSDDQMRAIKLSEIDSRQIVRLFAFQGIEEREAAMARFALIPKEEIMKALEKRLVPPEVGPLIPEEFLRTLNVNHLDPFAINRIIEQIFGAELRSNCPETNLESRMRYMLIPVDQRRILQERDHQLGRYYWV